MKIKLKSNFNISYPSDFDNGDILGWLWSDSVKPQLILTNNMDRLIANKNDNLTISKQLYEQMIKANIVFDKKSITGDDIDYFVQIECNIDINAKYDDILTELNIYRKLISEYDYSFLLDGEGYEIRKFHYDKGTEVKNKYINNLIIEKI